jgi:hypothetical protein
LDEVEEFLPATPAPRNSTTTVEEENTLFWHTGAASASRQGRSGKSDRLPVPALYRPPSLWVSCAIDSTYDRRKEYFRICAAVIASAAKVFPLPGEMLRCAQHDATLGMTRRSA